MGKLYRARSLLYRRQILQENMRWKVLSDTDTAENEPAKNLQKKIAKFGRFDQMIAMAHLEGPAPSVLPRPGKETMPKPRLAVASLFQIWQNFSDAYVSPGKGILKVSRTRMLIDFTTPGL